MMLLLWLAAAAADPAQSIADPGQRRAAEACAAGLSHKARGEISSFDSEHIRHSGRMTILDGTMRVLQKPAARPGEMTATHVIVARYSFTCQISGRSMPRIRLHRLD